MEPIDLFHTSICLLNVAFSCCKTPDLSHARFSRYSGFDPRVSNLNLTRCAPLIVSDGSMSSNTSFEVLWLYLSLYKNCRSEEFDEKLQQRVPAVHRLAARGEIQAPHLGGVDSQRPGAPAHHHLDTSARRGVGHLEHQVRRLREGKVREGYFKIRGHH